MDETTDNRQKNLGPMLSETKPVRLFTNSELSLAKTPADALYMTWKLSGRPRKCIEHDSGIAPETMSRMFSGTQ